MKLMKRSTKIATVLTIAGLVLGNLAGANAASKTITCYKGTTVKKVTAANPKCPTGFSTTKPKATTTTTPAKGGTIAINATYKGKVTMVWGEADVTVTSVTATGTGATGGLDSLTGNGTASPASVKVFQFLNTSSQLTVRVRVLQIPRYVPLTLVT